MKMIYIPNDLGERLTCDGINALSSDEIQSIWDDIHSLDSEANISEANLGAGADWIWIMIGLTYTILERGDKINKGLEGWVKIANRIKKFLKRFRNSRLDIDVATVLVLEKVVSLNKKVTSIEILFKDQKIFNSQIGMFSTKKIDDLETILWAYYLIGVNVNHSTIYIVGCSISGEVEILKVINLNKLDIFQYESSALF